MTLEQGSVPDNRQRLSIPALETEKSAFAETIVGQDEAIDAFATLFAKIKSGVRSKRPQPIDVKFLAGPSGVGKTESVYCLAEILANGDPLARGKVIKINGGDYSNGHEVAKLIGSPPGYRGSDDPQSGVRGTKPIFSQENLDSHRIFYTDNFGKDRDVVLILVDEAEKADIALHQAFLSVLDKGEVELGNNTSSDFTNSVIFYTSNVGNRKAEQYRRQLESGGGDLPQAYREAFLRDDTSEIVSEEFVNAFPPEFRGKIKELVIFNSLTREHLGKIVDIKLKRVEEDFAESGINIKLGLSDEARQFLIDNGFNPSEGARALEKVIEHHIENQLAIVQTGVDLNGKTIQIELDERTGKLAFYFNSADGETKQEAEQTSSATTKATKQQTRSNNTSSQAESGAREEDYIDDPQVPKAIVKDLVDIMRGPLSETNLLAALDALDATIRQHYFSNLADRDAMQRTPAVQKIIREWLSDIVKAGRINDFARLRDILYLRNFGSKEEFNELLKLEDRNH